MVLWSVLFAGLLARPVGATELFSECPLLSDEEVQELDARLQLLMRAHADEAPTRVVVRCAGDALRVSVEGERTMDENVDASAGRVDGVLDAVERVLARRAAVTSDSTATEPTLSTEAASSGAELAPKATDSTQPKRLEPLPPREHRDAGGVGLGLTTEYAFPPIGTLLGPRLDLAVGRGPYAVSLAETLRFSSARGRQLLDFDVMAGFGFGAPYVGTHDFGAHLGVGVEWLSAGIDRRRLTDSSPIAQLSVLTAWPLGWVTLWASIDVRARFQTLSLDDPIDAKLPRFTPLLSIGGLVLADVGSR